MISVLIVDPKPLVCSGIREILGRAGDFEVVGISADCDEAIVAVRRHRPGVVLISEDADGVGPLEATRRLLADDVTAVVGIGTTARGPFARRMLNCGARSVVTYHSGAHELVAAIRFTAVKQTYLSADVLRQLAQESLLPRSQEGPWAVLSNRELQVFRMIVNGRGPESISRQLCLSPKTVSTYRYRISRKLGTRNDVELVRLALAYGLLEESRAGVAGCASPVQG